MSYSIFYFSLYFLLPFFSLSTHVRAAEWAGGTLQCYSTVPYLALMKDSGQHPVPRCGSRGSYPVLQGVYMMPLQVA
jgi:hypothetical protein